MSQLTKPQEKSLKKLELWLPFVPINWNEYIKIERGYKGYYQANNIKQREKGLVSLFLKNRVYEGSYPCEIILEPHFRDHRQDLDNLRYKGLIDGLVSAGAIRNDNLKAIQKITLIPIFDNEEGMKITVKELNQDGKDTV